MVYLYPHTKTAGQYCWLKKQAVVEEPGKTHWPRIKVTLVHQGQDITSFPHKDDVRLRPAPKNTKAEKREGDTNQGTEASGIKVRIMPGKPIENLEGQEPLW